ncbi:MAG TPA: biotin transporter BioY [Burkholderiaceae bacterium]|nr:biotin transporter BioY [Burkholderiaceae bacterium]
MNDAGTHRAPLDSPLDATLGSSLGTAISAPITASMHGSIGFGSVILAAAGVVLLTLSAHLQVPLWPVPMTMQTYVVLVIAMAYGRRLGMATMLAYLFAGAAGLPVFAGTPEKGLGVAYMAGPTGGYLVGFAVATWLVAKLAERGWDRRFVPCLAAMTAGHLLILGCGVAWLAVLIGGQRAIAVGFTPFVVATVLKTLLAAATLPAAWHAVSRLKR